jgi:multidrug efflux pump subunit AcrB
MKRRSIRIDGEFTSVEDLYNVIVKDEKQRIVYLRDIAEVVFGPIEPTSFARMDGNPVVMLDVKKKSGENLIRAAEGINEILKNSIGKRVPADLKITITNDQSTQTKSMVSNLENSIISGIILVVLVLLFFLGLRNSLFVGIAIPMSMLMGIAILNVQGATLNMMVLFSLILALGMLVDNGIVVVENIYRKYTEEGLTLKQASKEGVGEVAIPIIASTATTLAAFFPLLFWKDIIGEFMKFLPLTLIIVLSSSLFVALVINPVLTANFMQNDSKKANTELKKFIRIFVFMLILGIILIFTSVRWIGSLLVILAIFSLLYRFILRPAAEKFQTNVMSKLESSYERFVKFALRRYNPLFIFIGTILMLFLSIGFFISTNPKFLFFPENEPRNVNVYIEMPLGTDIERTNAFTKEVEKRINKAIQPNLNIVDAVLTQVGEGTGDPGEGPQMSSSPNKSKVTVAFIDYDKRVKVSKTPTSSVMEDIRKAVEDMPEALITVEKNREGPPVGKPINIEISGDEFDSLIVISDRMIKFLEDANVPGVDQLKVDLETDKPELLVKIDSDAARRYGVSKYAIGMAMRTALFGKEISKFKEGEDDYKIQLRVKDEYRYDISKLLNIKITFRDPASGRIAQVPVSALVELEYGTTYGSVRRKDMERVVNIFSGVKEGYNANEIVLKYKKLLESFEIPEGYTMKFTGEQEEQNKSSEFLQNAFLIAFLLIFLIIVTQFNSIISPLIIMFSVLFSTIGVFLGFGIFKMDFVILMCGIGIISLAGVVVNNAIVLIDYTNLLRANKRKELGIGEDDYLPANVLLETITEAGRKRLRPVLLTAITTILGLIPLAIGMNIDFIGLLNNFDPDFYLGGDNTLFWGPMSWTVIFGLTFATFLTLIVVPVMYILSDKLTRAVKKLMKLA